MRRLTLSTKLLVAALPLLVALGALLAITVQGDLADVKQAENGVELGNVWDPLIGAILAVEAEAESITADNSTIRRATDDAINELRDTVARIDAAEAAGDHITSSRSALSAGRRNIDMGTITPDLQTELDPSEAYAQASRELVAVGQLLPSEAGDPELGRELLAVVKLAEAKLAADSISNNIARWQDDPTDIATLSSARTEFAELTAVLGEFEAIAPDEWAAQYREAGFTAALAGYRSDLDRIARTAQSGESTTFPVAEFDELVSGGVQFLTGTAHSIVERAQADADSTRSTTWRRIAIVISAGALAGLLAWLLTRSITKRIRAVAEGARKVSVEQLPALVEALRDPRGSASLPPTEPITTRGEDELAELAAAFNTMQDTLGDVAHQQVDVLRRGVSDIFVTMARRNRSLIDRQLALLDDYEAEVDDPKVLANYYQLDHMATRMRRNSESLLVLANAEPKRRRVKATEVDDVVRAAIGEIEDYQRIEVEALESLYVRGNVVADVSHLLAELFDNATSFSPPDSLVRVGGRRSADGYMIRIVDAGVGIGAERLRELNELLRTPPIVGLSVEPTLGMSVISLLANKLGIRVTLSAGNPGLIVDVILPSGLFGDPEPTVKPLVQRAADAETPAAPKGLGPLDLRSLDLSSLSEVTVDRGVRGSDLDSNASFDSFAGDNRPVAASDLRATSLNLAAFKSGMQSATEPVSSEPVSSEPVSSEPVSSEPAATESTVDTAATRDDSSTPVFGLEAALSEVSGRLGFAESTGTDLQDFADIGTLASALGAKASESDESDESDDLTDLPPPSDPLPRSEFQIPPAPPNTTVSRSHQPLTPDFAQPAPALPSTGDGLGPNLPSRLPGDGPDGGPDRLAPSPTPTVLGGSHLPVRDRESASMSDQANTNGSSLDPEALRDRLRSFQAEFRSALAESGESQPDQADRLEF